MAVVETKGAALPARRRPRVFYGWYVIAVTMAGGFLAAGTSQLFMGVMLKPITDEFGWSRTSVAGAITLGTLGAGLLSLPAGWLVDKYGPRLLAPLGALVVVGAYAALANINALWQFYLAYLVGRGVAATSLGGVVSMTVAANWFQRHRGRAMGLVAMSLPLGGSVLALVAQIIIENEGWRTVFLCFAVLLFVIYFIPACLIIRRRPEDIGLLPDGRSEMVDSSPDRPAEAPEESWTLNEAVRTRALWLLIAGVTLGVMANGAVGFHQVAYYTDQGIPATQAATVLGVYAFSGAMANGLWGFVVEWISERMLAVIVTLLSAVAVGLLLLVDSTIQALGFAVMFGLMARGESSIVMMIIAQYYGRNAYGRISGFVTPFQMVGLGVGPLIASASYDLSGSYTRAFVLFALSYLVTAFLFWLAKRPVRSAAAAERALALSER
jgi:MFS family permease